MRIDLQDLRVILRHNNNPILLRDNSFPESHEVFFKYCHFFHQKSFEVLLDHGGKLVVNLLTFPSKEGDFCVLEFMVCQIAGCVEFVPERSVADKHGAFM